MSGATRDIVVIGGSAGGLTALHDLLPAMDLGEDAAAFVVLHTGEGSTGNYAAILGRLFDGPVRFAEDGQPIEPGTLTVAPPNRHLILGTDHVHLRRGPRENNFRPAIDPLFRSAAVHFGTRAVGVVLPGFLDDGAAGLLAIERRGGCCLVQDPETTDYPDMLHAALSAVSDCRIAGPGELGALIGELAGTAVEEPAGAVDPSLLIELKIACIEGATVANEDRLGELSPYNCPDCNGVLWKIDDGPITRFRCHTGHAYTERTLSAAQEEALERRLYDVLRAHRGRAHLLRSMSERSRDLRERDRLIVRSEDYERDGDIIQGLLANGPSERQARSR